jgi:hypothetical protein
MKKKLTTQRIKKYFELLAEAEDEFSASVGAIESLMQLDTGIKGLEFFYCDNSIVGIGTEDRKMKLIHRR